MFWMRQLTLKGPAASALFWQSLKRVNERNHAFVCCGCNTIETAGRPRLHKRPIPHCGLSSSRQSYFSGEDSRASNKVGAFPL